MKKAKVLVTGGAGYIGSVAVRKLVNSGFNVRVLDTFWWGRQPLADIAPKIELVKADIRNAKAEVLKDIDVVIHLAGLSNDPMANFNPQANFAINCQATGRFAKLCQKNGIAKFIFASSASIYHRANLPANVVQNEKSPVSPKAYYSVSKYEAEKALLQLADDNFHPIIFRQGTVYGFSPRMRYDLVVNTMVKDALVFGKIFVFCQGKEFRPLIDIADCAAAYILAIKVPATRIGGQIFNLVHKNYNILDLAKMIQRTLKTVNGINPQIIVSDSMERYRSYQITGEKFAKVFDWQPQTSPQTAIRQILNKITKTPLTDLKHPRFYNIEWLKRQKFLD